MVAITRPSGTREVAGPREVRSCPVDLRDLDELTRTLSGCEVVAHLAAPRRQPDRSRGFGTGASNLSVIAQGSATLVEATARAGARRFVLASSTAVYGHPWQEVDEESPVRPDTPYGHSRLVGERLSRAAAVRLGVELTVARLSEVYGPGSVGHQSLIESVLCGNFRVVGDGRHAHQIVHVEDAARALEACGSRDKAAGATMLISGPRVTFRDWVGGIASAAGVEVTYTPRFGLPARLALRSLPRAVLGSRWQMLDYQIRPRAYALDRSLELLGPYQRVSLERGLSDLIRPYPQAARS